MKEENRSDEVTYVLNESDTAHFTTPAKLFEMSNCIDAEEFNDSDVGQGLSYCFFATPSQGFLLGCLPLSLLERLSQRSSVTLSESGW